MNTASRMEGASSPMRINISEATARLLGGRIPLAARAEAEIKGKGSMKMYFVE